MTLALLSLALFAAVAAIVAVAAAASRPFFRLAVRFLRGRKRLTALAILGLLVPSSMIAGSLAVGDSMKAGVVEGVYGNLGAVDEVVSSNGLFNASVFDALNADAGLGGVTDGMAPLLALRGSVRNVAADRVESNVNLLGLDARFAGMGHFHVVEGAIGGGVPARGEAFVNEELAGRIGVGVGDTVRVTARNPAFTIESIFSLRTGQVTLNVSVSAVVRDEGLGRFSLQSGGKVAANVFLDLGILQETIGGVGRINAIVVSNHGGDREGVARTDDVTNRLQTVLDQTVGFRDLKFHVDPFGYVRLDNDNVFFDGRYLDVLRSFVGQIPDLEAVSPLASYFVNNLSFGGQSVAYSTVTGFDPTADAAFGSFTSNASGLPTTGDIEDDEIILTNYTALRLGAGVGDVVTLNFTTYDRTYSPVYTTAAFTVAHVVDLTGKALDPNLMPPFPGIRGKSSCGDWDPPWISGDKMRSEMVYADLDYWVQYGGTPKAYLTLGKAQSLWSNDLGNLTTVKAKTSDPAAVAASLGARLNASIVAGDAGIQVLPVKASGLESAEGVQLLTETFLSFGVVVILSGVILAVALVGMIVEGRRNDIGVLRTVGAGRRQVTRTFAFEGFLLAAVASLLGLLAGLLIAFACIALTNAFWSNIVEGTSVQLHVTLDSLALGYLGGFLIAFLSFVLSAHAASGSLIARAFRGAESEERTTGRPVLPLALTALGVLLVAAFLVAPLDASLGSLAGLAGPVLAVLSLPFLVRDRRTRDLAVRACALAAIAYAFAFSLVVAGRSDAVPFLLFFASGFAIVLACVVGLWASLRPLASGLARGLGAFGPRLGVFRISFLSPSRRAHRTCLAVSLFAIVVFTFLGLSVNIQGQQANLQDLVDRQGAGYDVFAESAISLRFDLGNATDRAANNLTDFPPDAEVVQFLSFGQVGGSCSNLKRNLPPRLVGANGTFVRDSRLRFQAPDDAAWSSLEEERADGAIPAIGDANTVIWILGKNVGDRLAIIDERGAERQLVIAAITENSIFPGSVFVSEANLDTLYPTAAEYTLFLFKTDDPSNLVTYLESALEPYGMDAAPVDQLVKDNLSVEWSYMGLFQALLLLGLFVGILGLAAGASRAVEERRTEIGAVRAIGFRRSSVLATLVVENLYVAALGAAIGIVAGLLTAYAFFGRGSLLSYGVAVPWVAITAVILAVGLVALLATIAPARRAARISPVEALRRDR